MQCEREGRTSFSVFKSRAATSRVLRIYFLCGPVIGSGKLHNVGKCAADDTILTKKMSF